MKERCRPMENPYNRRRVAIAEVVPDARDLHRGMTVE
jgi:hypothetical protein